MIGMVIVEAESGSVLVEQPQLLLGTPQICFSKYFSSSFLLVKALKQRPTSGIVEKPKTRTGEEKVASFNIKPLKSSIFFILAYWLPIASISPVYKVPFLIIKVIVTPIF